MAHKMPTTHVGCYRPAVLDGGSNPPISTGKENGSGRSPGAVFLLRVAQDLGLRLGADLLCRHFHFKNFEISHYRAVHGALSGNLDQSRPLICI